jgi:hypothetical protein
MADELEDLPAELEEGLVVPVVGDVFLARADDSTRRSTLDIHMYIANY